MEKTRFGYAAVAACFFAGACASSISPEKEGQNASGTETLDDVFPKGLALASPYASSGSSAKDGRAQSRYDALLNDIDGVLAHERALPDVFDPHAWIGRNRHDAQCFGPTVAYRNHPDGADFFGSPGVTDPSLPSGDLGIWLVSEPVTGEACAAAALNRRLEAVFDPSSSALTLFAVIARSAIDSHHNFAHGPFDATAELTSAGVSGIQFLHAELARETMNTWRYEVRFSIEESGRTREASLFAVHQGFGLGAYEGSMGYVVDGPEADHVGFGASCPNTTRKKAASIRYSRHANEVAIQSRSATFCGDAAPAMLQTALDAQVAHPVLAPMLSMDPQSPSNRNGWTDNFHLFVASFDATTREGNYAYAWQAGANDSNSRVFNFKMRDRTDGTAEAYYGYGAPMPRANGVIETFACNWTAIGGTRDAHPFAQRQSMVFEPASGLYVASEASSDIRYAPTTSCAYDGQSNFVLDRNLNHDLSDENSAMPIATDLLDLDANDDGMADFSRIEEVIAARGYQVPDAIGGWPGEQP